MKLSFFDESVKDSKIQQQYNLFTGKPEPIPIDLDVTKIPDSHEIEIEKGLSIVKVEDSTQLMIGGYGTFIGKKSERLVIRLNKKVIYEIPFFRISEVIVTTKGVSFSSDVIWECATRGIKFLFLSGSGAPYAILTTPVHTATVKTRREQLECINDKRSVVLAKEFLSGKATNQSNLLKYFAKYIKNIDFDKYHRLDELSTLIKSFAKQIKKVRGEKIDEVRKELLGLEGKASALYWEGVKIIIKERTQFLGREKRGTLDKVNILLNYGYGILYNEIWSMVLNAGLEPFGGILHTDRSGKPSLILDLIEEFRQPIVDRTVISYVNVGKNIKVTHGMLDIETRKRFSEDIMERLNTRFTYKGKKLNLRSIMQRQIRDLVSFLHGRIKRYTAYRFKW